MAQAIPVFYGDNDTVAQAAQNLKGMGMKLSNHWNGRFEAVPLPVTKDAELTEQDRRADALKQRVDVIKAQMGDKLICHPAYKTNPRHSFNPEVYNAARAPYLAAIAAAAAADRERNPAFHRAQRIASNVGEL